MTSLHRQGWRVVTCGRDATKLGQLAQALPGVRTYQCDVSDKASVVAFVAWVSAAFPRIKLLFNNVTAGLLPALRAATPSQIIMACRSQMWRLLP